MAIALLLNIENSAVSHFDLDSTPSDGRGDNVSSGNYRLEVGRGVIFSDRFHSSDFTYSATTMVIRTKGQPGTSSASFACQSSAE